MSCLQHAFAGSQPPATLPQVVRQTMALYFAAQKPSPDAYKALAQSVPLTSAYRKPAGVFVTLSRTGKPRACWGSVYPKQPDLVHATIEATLGALTKEYRYPPIQPHEWRHLNPQVTVIRRIQPAHGVSSINPLRDGLMVRAGGKSGVILPGEAKDAHYQLVQAKLKAGIQPKEPYQLYRMVADVYR